MREVINVSIPDPGDLPNTIGDALYEGEIVKISINGEKPVLCVVVAGGSCNGCYIQDHIGPSSTAACPHLHNGLACVWSADISLKLVPADTLLEDL